MKTTETHTVRVNGSTGGTFTLTFGGETTAPIASNATAAGVAAALEALGTVAPGDLTVTGGPVDTANVTLLWTGQYLQQNIDAPVANGSGLTGTTPTVTVTTTVQGNLFNAPFVDARRTALNTNDLRGKVNRIKVNADGSYSIPSGNLFAPGTAKTRPEIYAMGFRNPFRIQVDDEGVAYVTDYSPDSQTPQQYRGPAGTGRVEVVRKPANYGWPLCYSPDLPYYRWNFLTSTPLDSPAQPHECGNPNRGPRNDSRWNLEGGPTVEPGLEYSPPITKPDIWYSYQDNNATTPLGNPCFASYGPTAPTTPTCPQLTPELLNGGVGPHGAAPYDYDATSASTTKFPPYYDGSFILGEFTRDFLREVRIDEQGNIMKINHTLSCGQAVVRTDFPFECDNPMDIQFGEDGSLYLLTYGDGFFAANPDAGMYRFDYVKGQRAPKAVLTASPTSGQEPLTVSFSSAGSSDADPADSITFAWDFDGNGTTDSIEAAPTHVYTTTGQYTAQLTVTDTSGKTGFASTVITVGNTAPSVTLTTPVRGGTFAFGDSIPFSVTVSDPEDGPIDCSQVLVTFVLGHDTHGHAEDEANGLHRRAGDLRRRRVARRQRVRRHQRDVQRPRRRGRPGPDHDRSGGDPPASPGGGVRRRATRHQHGRHLGRGRWTAARVVGQRRLAPAQRALQPRQHRLADAAHVGWHRGRRHRRRRGPPRHRRRAVAQERDRPRNRRGGHLREHHGAAHRPRWSPRAVRGLPACAGWTDEQLLQPQLDGVRRYRDRSPLTTHDRPAQPVHAARHQPLQGSPQREGQ